MSWRRSAFNDVNDWDLNFLKFEQRSGKGGAQSCIPLAADIRDKLNWIAVAKIDAVLPCDS